MADSIRITPALTKFWNAVLMDGSFTYDDIRARGGPSQPTLTKITQGEGTISDSSAKNLEEAIGLERGSIRRIAEGGGPHWKPEGAPDEESTSLVLPVPDGTYRTSVGVVEGYFQATFWAHQCWQRGAPRQLYHAFMDVCVELYGSTLEAMESTSSTEYSKEFNPASLQRRTEGGVTSGRETSVTPMRTFPDPEDFDVQAAHESVEPAGNGES